MKGEPCSVCGGTDVNLVDGFYYCVECGTQDVNAQETVITETFLGNGTITLGASKKFATVLKEGIEMSGEWYKWHTYNFILSGLADELVALGASPDFKMKVLWVWTRYVKQYQVKEEVRETNQLIEADEPHLNGSKTSINEDDYEGIKKKRTSKTKELNIVTKQTLLTILYIALNLDHSDIQLSHLLKYMKDKQLSIANCTKFIPKEINTKLIPHWNCFAHGTSDFCAHTTRSLAMTLFEKLNLGTPLVPNVRKLIDNYVTELCLPQAFKNLVFSLMNLIPYDKEISIRLPDFEGISMAYVLVALKMCFGLDDDYEIKLSECIDKINTDQNHVKCYRMGYSVEAERLFSFREWCNYVQFRKVMLCKYYLPFAQQFNMHVDDQVFMEHLFDRPKQKVNLSDEVTMDILRQIPLDENIGVIPKSEFKTTLTPMSTYTGVILEYIQDPDLKILLSEDFTRYSLSYACEGVSLPNEYENVVTGINEDDKILNPNVIGTLVTKKSNLEMVYVRNCENKNWLITKPPTKEHIEIENVEKDIDDDFNNNSDINDTTNITETTNLNKDGGNIEKDNDDVNNDSDVDALIINDTDNIHNTDTSNLSDKDSDHGYDSSTIESIPDESKLDTKAEIKIEQESKPKSELQEEDPNINIFDDDFEDLVKDDKKDDDFETNENGVNYFQFENDNPNDDSKSFIDNIDQDKSLTELSFDPDKFDRTGVIKELVLGACRKYKIPIPSAFKTFKPRKERAEKRKSDLLHIGVDVVQKKKPRRRRKEEINELLDAYYNTIVEDLAPLSEHVQSMVQRMQDTFEEEIRSNQISDDNDKDKTAMDKDPEDIDLDNTGLDDVSISSVRSASPKCDPRFDEKTHDIRQLYIKLKENFSADDLIDYDDPDLVKILSRQLEREENPTNNTENTETSKKDKSETQKARTREEIAGDIEETKIVKEIENQSKEKLEDLIKSFHHKNYKYWFRHYNVPAFKKNVDMQSKFDLELKENFPKSFNFVIQECAAILDCTAYTLYKHMQYVEQMLIEYRDS